jgi:Bacterial Ig domain
MAPERHAITGGLSEYSYTNEQQSAAYLPIITALKDSIDLVHTQLYGTGSDVGKDGNVYSTQDDDPYKVVGSTREDLALAVTEDLMLGYTLNHSRGVFTGLSADKIALGFATPCEAASVGFLTTAQIQNVVNYFKGTGPKPGVYTKYSGAVNLRGLMTWSINYDMSAACSNNSFATTYTGLYGAFTASVNPKNILTFTIPSQVGASVIDANANTITVTMPFGTVLTSLIPTYTLSPNTFLNNLVLGLGRPVNFSAPVQYTVNHQDNSSKTWTVIVNVSSGGLAVTANPATICAGSNSFLTASGCAGNVTWNTGATATAIYVYPNTTTPYTATCSAGGSGSATVTVNPNPALTITSSVPITISDCGGNEVVYLHANQTTTLTASGCTGTIKWDNYTNTYSGTTLSVTAPSLNTENGMKFISITCTNSNGCVSNGFMTILNQFATDDNYTTALNTTFSGNVITNDTETSVAWGAYGPTTTAHGTISWVLGTPRPTGAFTYTPNTGFQGVDSFTYFVSDDLTCSKHATVTITVGTPPCPTNIVVDGNSYVLNTITGTASFNASNSVSTTPLLGVQTKIGSLANVTFQGGSSVTLSPGFSTQAGAVFTAKIGACPNVVQPPYSVQKIVYQYGTDPNLTPLIVDIYQPSVATSASRKPLIIFTHGTGNNDSNPHGSGTHAMAQYLAENQGFVAAYFNFYGSDNTRLQDDGQHLLANYDAVITYLQNNAATYGINPNAIILHGTSGSAAAAMSVAVKKGVFGSIIEAGGRNIGIESYEPASITVTISMAGVQSQSDVGFGGYRYNTADVRSGASHNYNLWTENTALAQVAYPGQQGYCTAWNDCSLTESFTYYTTKYGNPLLRKYPLVVTGQSHGPEATTQTQWTNFMQATPKLMLNDRGITW